MPFLRSLLRCACLSLAAFSLGGQPEELPIPYGTFGAVDEALDWIDMQPLGTIKTLLGEVCQHMTVCPALLASIASSMSARFWRFKSDL